MKKEILEILERVYTASQKAHQEHKDEVKRIEANYKGEARLNALTETNNEYYEALRSNEEKALNEVNAILDQATERVKTIITSTLFKLLKKCYPWDCYQMKRKALI